MSGRISDIAKIINQNDMKVRVRSFVFLHTVFLFQSFCCCFVFYKRNINDSKSNRNLNENIDHADVNIPLDDMQMIEEIQP